jgi:MFS family permease
VSDPTADREAGAARIPRAAIFAMIVLCVAVFVAALDLTMVLTLMKKIMASLSITGDRVSDAGWIITGYLLGYTVAMPLFGRLADVKGRRPMALVALTLFLAGSGLCVIFDKLGLFVAARVVQSAGGGALVPIAMAAAADMFPLSRRGLMLGIVGGAAEAGGVLGPLYGVGLDALWYWRLIFIVNIPLCLILMAFCWWVLRNERALSRGEAWEAYSDADIHAPTEAAERVRPRWWNRGRVDYVGAAFMALILAGVTIGLGTGAEHTSPVNWPWLAVAAVCLVAFVLYDRQRPHPLIRLDFFKRPAFAAANGANFLLGAALIIGMVEVPLYAYTLFGLSELHAGLLLLQLTIPMVLGAVFGGWLSDWIGCRVTAVLGFLITVVGYLLISRWSIDPTFWRKLTDLAISGFGFGLVIGPVGYSVTTSVGPKWMATGSAMVTVSRMIGMAVGLSALSAWGTRRFNAIAASSVDAVAQTVVRTPDMSDLDYNVTLSQAVTNHSLHQVFNELFLIGAVIAAVAIIPALFFVKRRAKGVPFLLGG